MRRATLTAPIVLFQCPPSFEPTDEHKENVRAFFGEIERGDFIFAWEPRGEWQDTEIAQLGDDLGLVHCVDPSSAFRSRMVSPISACTASTATTTTTPMTTWISCGTGAVPSI